jgi:hypothetical protein
VAFPSECSHGESHSSKRVGNDKILAALGATFLNETQKIAWIDAAKETLTILQSCKTNDFDGIVTGDES